MDLQIAYQKALTTEQVKNVQRYREQVRKQALRRIQYIGGVPEHPIQNSHSAPSSGSQ